MAEVKRPDQATFELTCDGPAWKAIPAVNGHVVAAASVDVHLDPEHFPEVTLRLIPADLLKIGLSPALVKVDDETREALISLGWTPPDAPAAIVSCPRDWTAEQVAEFERAWDEFRDRYQVRWLPPGPEIKPIPPEPATDAEIEAADTAGRPRPCGTSCDC